MKLATCISCACNDNRACDDAFGLGGACSWLKVDRAQGVGVCSVCPKALERWDRGDRRIRGRFVLFFRKRSRPGSMWSRPTWFCDSTATLAHPNTTSEEQYARRYTTRGAAAGVAKRLGTRCGTKFKVGDTEIRT